MILQPIEHPLINALMLQYVTCCLFLPISSVQQAQELCSFAWHNAQEPHPFGLSEGTLVTLADHSADACE